MVKSRAGIIEDEEPDKARDKLHRLLEEHLTDADEQRWAEPRLSALLGLADAGNHDRESLFAGWRLLFERMSQHEPVVLVFEDMQWADMGLLDFIDYLLEWSRGYRILVVTLARSEIAERRPGWGANKSNCTSLHLEPLSTAAMRSLLTGLLLERAGHAAFLAGRLEPARDIYRQALEIFDGSGDLGAAARVGAKLAEVDYEEGRLAEAVERMEDAYAVLIDREPDESGAALGAQLGRLHFFLGDAARALERLETALNVAEPMGLLEVISQALNTRSMGLLFMGRHEESRGLIEHALRIAVDAELPGAALRAYVNLAEHQFRRDWYEQAELTPVLEATRLRFGARLAATRGDDELVANGFKAAAGAFREAGAPYWLALTLLEHGEWLAGRGDADAAGPSLDEARRIFTSLGAKAVLARLDRIPDVSVRR